MLAEMQVVRVASQAEGAQRVQRDPLDQDGEPKGERTEHSQ